uniref:Uncharacterized protein n=2 Tax=Lygus hesperus TaxID=30085 RepID=A0A0A9WTI4_LYGHE
MKKKEEECAFRLDGTRVFSSTKLQTLRAKRRDGEKRKYPAGVTKQMAQEYARELQNSAQPPSFGPNPYRWLPTWQRPTPRTKKRTGQQLKDNKSVRGHQGAVSSGNNVGALDKSRNEVAGAGAGVPPSSKAVSSTGTGGSKKIAGQQQQVSAPSGNRRRQRRR